MSPFQGSIDTLSLPMVSPWASMVRRVAAKKRISKELLQSLIMKSVDGEKVALHLSEGWTVSGWASGVLGTKLVRIGDEISLMKGGSVLWTIPLSTLQNVVVPLGRAGGVQLVLGGMREPLFVRSTLNRRRLEEAVRRLFEGTGVVVEVRALTRDDIV